MCVHVMCETETKLCSATAMQAIVHIRSQRGKEGLNPPHGQPGVHLRQCVVSGTPTVKGKPPPSLHTRALAYVCTL